MANQLIQYHPTEIIVVGTPTLDHVAASRFVSRNDQGYGFIDGGLYVREVDPLSAESIDATAKYAVRHGYRWRCAFDAIRTKHPNEAEADLTPEVMHAFVRNGGSL